MLTRKDRIKIINFIREHPLGVSINQIITASRKNNQHVRAFIDHCEFSGLIIVKRRSKRFSVTIPSDETSYEFLLEELGGTEPLQLLSQLSKGITKKNLKGKKRKDFVNDMAVQIFRILEDVRETFFFSITPAFGTKVAGSAKRKMNRDRRYISRILLGLSQIDEKLTKEIVENVGFEMVKN